MPPALAPSPTPPAASGEIAARIDRLPMSWTLWKLVILLSLGFFFELYDLLYSGYVVPGMIKSGVLAPGAAGLQGVASFIAALFAGLFIGTMACGFLADRFGRRAIFTYSLLWYTGANLVMAFQHSAASVDAWRFLAGIGIGVELVTIGAYISELVPKHVRGRAFACEQAVGFCAVPVAALMAYLLVPHRLLGLDGWRWVVIIGAHGALFVWFIRRALPESPRWLAQRGRLAEAQQVLSTLEAAIERETGRPLPPVRRPEQEPAKRRFRDMWAAPYRKRIVMMSLFNVFQTIGFYGFANWVPTLLVQQGITVTKSLLYSWLIAIAAPLGPVLGLWIADRVERKTMIVATAMGVLAFGLGFSQVTSAPALIAMGIGLTLASNMMSYNFHAYQAELFPTDVRAGAVGFVYSWSRLSAIFTSFLIAAVLGQFGSPGVFALIAGSMLVVAAVIGSMGPRTRDLSLEAISH